MKIYTKTGDDGTTSLLGGKRVPKNHIRIESYGNVDELNSNLGLLKDQEESKPYHSVLSRIQNNLFSIGSHLATEEGSTSFPLPELNKEEILFLEKEMDEMNSDLPEMKNFILLGGNQVSSIAHVCRCVCRRAERSVILLSQESQIQDFIQIYLNRLSDYLFILARKLIQDTNSEETPWIPRKK